MKKVPKLLTNDLEVLHLLQISVNVLVYVVGWEVLYSSSSLEKVLSDFGV
jgi:hypothetical protein